MPPTDGVTATDPADAVTGAADGADGVTDLADAADGADGATNAAGAIADAAVTVQVAVPVPLRRVFDYRCPTAPPAGARVRVPFGKRDAVGVVVGAGAPEGGRELKAVGAVLDAANPFGARLLELVLWAADYYHHPPGEALAAALPAALRKGKAMVAPRRGDDDGVAVATATVGAVTDNADDTDTDADTVAIGAVATDADTVKSPAGDVADDTVAVTDNADDTVAVTTVTDGTLQLNDEQRHAADAITAAAGFASTLLHGVTGSGKTEVYLEAAARCIARGGQVLILAPEIALTPQLVARVRTRLNTGVGVLHSALTDAQRYRAWWRAREGAVAAVLGTRSAVFTPMKSLSLIIVDEEHDLSYKQQDGFRYHARDLAIKRAKLENIPVVLGSATPSMETFYNVRRGRHRLLTLTQRAGGAQLPRVNFVDLKRHRPADGLSAPLLAAIQQRMQRREQCIVFLNRRGFAPTAQCPCGWQAACARCDARLTYHDDGDDAKFRCHHCGRTVKAKLTCGACGEKLFLAGAGTQRLERALKKKFPDAQVRRLDRDRVTAQKKLEDELRAIRARETDIVVGTQLIAKGHDFAGVTLVGVVDSDQGLYSIDFRAPEYLFQQLMQVSGRAGRNQAGEVLIQTAHPGHRALQLLREHDFNRFASHCLDERRDADHPPFSHIVLWRAESVKKNSALQLLRDAAAAGNGLCARGGYDKVQIMDAVVSPMEKLAGRFRAQLMARSQNRAQLHRLLTAWVAAVENDPKSRRARWSVDVDPMEMF